MSNDKDIKNPFLLKGFRGKTYFCDRDEETERLTMNALNGVNTTILSIRRMGKTGLILNAFDEMKRKNQMQCIYVDIYATLSLKDFTNALVEAVHQAFPEKKTVGKQFIQLIKGLRPVITFDQLTGIPSFSFDFIQANQYEHTIHSIFNFLQKLNKPIVIAIDEFQQVGFYPEKNIEALLRTIIQQLKNIHFIFSGSNKHMLTQIFTDSKRPFFSSTQMLHLKEIDTEIYKKFIKKHFNNHKRKINQDALDFIVSFSKTHTYYTQVICNRLFAKDYSEIDLQTVKFECDALLKEQVNIFFQYRNLLTTKQWNLLIAVAQQDKLRQPTAQDFLSKYKLGNSSGVIRALDSLLKSEMIYKDFDEDGVFYRVYDCFLSRWLEINYFKALNN